MKRLIPVALLAIAILLPNLVFPYFEDTAGFAAIAKLHGEGLGLYRDLFDQKPPAIFYQEELRLLLFGRTSLACRASELLLLVVSGIVLGAVADRFLPEERRGRGRAAIAVAFAALSSTAIWGLPERGQVEFHQAAWTAVMIGATALAWDERIGFAALAGAAAAWICWLKPQAALMAPVPFVVFLVERKKKLAITFAGSAVLVTLVVLGRLAIRDELAAFREVMFRINPSYVKLGGGVDLVAATKRVIVVWLFSWRGVLGLPLVVAGAWSVVRAPAPRSLKVLIFWTLPWAIVQFASGAYLFEYQLIPTIVGLAVFMGLGVELGLSRVSSAKLHWPIAIATLAVFLSTLRMRDAAVDLVRWATRSLTSTQVYARHGNERHYFSYAQEREAARVVAAYVPAGETFHIFGRGAVTYLFADRHPVMRHLAITMGYLPLPAAKELRDEIVLALTTKPPRLLLVRTNDAFPWFGLPVPSSVLLEQDRDLGPFVKRRYKQLGKIGDGFIVLERCPADC